MVARIRADLDGSVFLHTGGLDGPTVLVAGDVVPEGYEVDAHLLADDDVEDFDPEVLADQLIEVDDNDDEGGAADESAGTDASPEPTVSEGTPLTSETVQPEPVKRSHKAKA